HQARREIAPGRLHQRGLLRERHLGPAVGQPGSAEPGELHPLLRLVRAQALLDLGAGHVQDAAGQGRVLREARGVDLLLRLRKLADRLLGREHARSGSLVLAALAGGGEKQDGGEEGAAHGARTLTAGSTYAQSIRATATEAVRPVKSASSPAASACRSRKIATDPPRPERP